MKKINLLLIVFSMLAFSCKDECKKVDCLNGATCEEGVCICADGYTGEDCGTETRAQYYGTYAMDSTDVYCELDTPIYVSGTPITEFNSSLDGLTFEIYEDPDNVSSVIIQDTSNVDFTLKANIKANNNFTIDPQKVNISNLASQFNVDTVTARGSGTFQDGGFVVTLVYEFPIDLTDLSYPIINAECTQSNIYGTKIN